MSVGVFNYLTTEKSLSIIRQNRKRPISKQRHPHKHFREIDRLMYPLKSPHPSPHHLSPLFSESFRSNLTSSNIHKSKYSSKEHSANYHKEPEYEYAPRKNLIQQYTTKRNTNTDYLTLSVEELLQELLN